MEHEPLDYATESSEDSSNHWGCLMALPLIAPIYAVIFFIEMTVVLQDRMGSSGGGSWRNAAAIVAIPTGLVTLLMLIISLAGVVRRTRPRWVAIAAVVANVVALAVIVCGVMVV